MKTSTARLLVLASAATLSFACAEGVPLEPSGDGGSGGEAATGPTVEACSPSDPCKPGHACHNGACAKGCNTDGDCEDGEYCAMEAGQVCQPLEIPSCPEVACTDTQACVNGMCGTQTGTPCGASPFSEADGCPDDQLCLGQVFVNGTMVEQNQCYTFPSCGPDLTCPVGSRGALCTLGVFPDKDAFCVPGMCLGVEHCPESFACVRPNTMTLTGACSDGAIGSLCATTADCNASSCVIEVPGLLGTCR